MLLDLGNDGLLGQIAGDRELIAEKALKLDPSDALALAIYERDG